MSSKTAEVVIGMHHRSLPVGSTASLEERLASVNKLLAENSAEIKVLEDEVRNVPFEKLNGELARLHELRATHRQAVRAQTVLERELRARERRGVPLSDG